MTFARFAFAVVAASTFAMAAAPSAQALTAQECSAKYKAAKDANTLGGKSWNEFRKSECGMDDASPAKAAAAGNATFPAAIAAKYASETPYKARLHTCAEQFKANKASKANGGLRWIQKGGGYWSECNKRLKATKA